MKLFGELANVERMVDYHLTRHSVLASNLSHSETPGYNPKDLIFDAQGSTQTGAARTNERHLQTVEEALKQYEVVESEGLKRKDGNGVQLEKAMAKVSANKLRFESGIEVLRRKLALLRYAATDGGR